jgi:recombination protein RecR
VAPDDLSISSLVSRAAESDVREVILALSATVEGQTTAHYLVDRLASSDVVITKLAHGVPIGGELDYLDDGTLGAALQARRPA